MRSFILAAVAAMARAAIDENDIKFMKFITKYSRSYSNMEEYLMRKEIFMNIDKEIIRLNTSQSRSRHGHNHLSDWTDEEYKRLLGFRVPDQMNFRPQAELETHAGPNQMWGSACP